MADLPTWVKDFVGLPFRYQGRERGGIDCYGIVIMIHREVFGNALPDYLGYGDEPTQLDLMPISVGAIEHGPWLPVEEPDPGDVVLLRLAGQPIHCGVVVSDTHMLHALHGIGTCIQRMDGAHWKERICGFYRFAGEGGAA